MMNEKNNQNQKRRGLKKRILWKRMFFYFSCFFYLFLLIYSFFYSNWTRIKKIEILNNSKVNSEEISKKIEQKNEGQNFLKIFKNNFFFVSENELEKEILNNFPKVKSVKITKIFPSKLQVDLTEFDIIFLVCLKNREDDNCFILENDGRILEKADFNSQKLKENEIFIIVDKNEGDNIEISSEFISSEKLKNIIFLGKELTFALNTKIEQPYFIPARGADEVKFITKDGWYILVDINNDPENTLKILKLFFEKGFENKKNDLEYIDLRMNEKIFWKLKEKEEKVDLDF